MSCPSDDELVRLVEGAAGGATVAGIEAHVDGCARCAAVIAGLGAMAPTPRRAVSRYELDRRIAAGGMGEVWAAWDPELRRPIAIKLVRPERADDDRERERLLREARALARLAHPNVLAVYDVGVERGEVFLATELVSGDTLASRAGGDWRALVALYVQAARGLAAAHAAGLVHRDVKPSNLLVGADGRVRVADFGLAVPVAIAEGSSDPVVDPTDERVDAPRVTVTGHVAGTPGYMAPEQRAGKPADARADQYALCVALTEAIAGRRPASSLDVAALTAFVSERRELDPALADACRELARGMARDPGARHADMTALADALDAIVAPRPVAVVAPRRSRAPLVAGAAIALAGVAIIGWKLADRGSTPDAPATTRTAAAHEPNEPATASAVRDAPSRTPAPTAVQTPPAVSSHAPPTGRAPGDAPRPATDRPPAGTGDIAAHRDTAPPPAPGAARERLYSVIWTYDAKACRDALAHVTGDDAAIGAGLCDMIAGDCARGTAEVADAMHGNAAGATVYADLLCPIEGDLATRLHRLSMRTTRAHLGAGVCESLLPAARAVAHDASAQVERTSAATVLVSLAQCVGRANRCDEARAVFAEATALLPALSANELPAACREP